MDIFFGSRLANFNRMKTAQGLSARRWGLETAVGIASYPK